MHSLSCQSLPALFSRRAGTSAVRSYAGRAVKLELLLIEYQYNLSIVEMGPGFKKLPALSLSAPTKKALHTDPRGKLSMTQAKPAQPQVLPHTTHAHTLMKEPVTSSTQASTLPRPLRISSWLCLARSLLVSKLLAGFTLLSLFMIEPGPFLHVVKEIDFLCDASFRCLLFWIDPFFVNISFLSLDSLTFFSWVLSIWDTSDRALDLRNSDT